jgi:hypothetical protein
VLVAATALILLPSTAFRSGRFEFYVLSWFHGYVALCTALLAAFFAVFARSRRTLLALGSWGSLRCCRFSRRRLAGAFVTGRSSGSMQSRK